MRLRDYESLEYDMIVFHIQGSFIICKIFGQKILKISERYLCEDQYVVIVNFQKVKILGYMSRGFSYDERGI